VVKAVHIHDLLPPLRPLQKNPPFSSVLCSPYRPPLLPIVLLPRPKNPQQPKRRGIGEDEDPAAPVTMDNLPLVATKEMKMKPWWTTPPLDITHHHHIG
jgi:hypothetical protein